MESIGTKPIQALVVREVGPSEIGEYLTAAPPPETAVAPVTPAAGMMTPATEFKKKRGRPRKYDGQGPGRVTLSPMPISASIPLSGDYSGWNHSQGRASEPIRKKQKVVFNSTDQPLSYTAGSHFMPHLLTVNAGEFLTATPHRICMSFGVNKLAEYMQAHILLSRPYQN